MDSADGNRYLIFVDHRFGSLARKELMQAFPDSEFVPYRVKGRTVLFIARIKSRRNIIAAAKKDAYTFVDFVLKVDESIERTENYQKAVCDAIAKILESQKGKAFRIEVKKVSGKLDDSAKSIEVGLGKELEERGFRADLKAPDLMVYVVFLNDAISIGHLDTAAEQCCVLDLFRYEDREISTKINRSELKMKEAVDFFNIDLHGIGKCLDIGAAPGGWTHYLSQHGIRVVAVDYALLDYAKLGNDRKILVLANDDEVATLRKLISEQNLEGNVMVESANGPDVGSGTYDIVHVKATLKTNSLLRLLRRLGKFDLLAIDVNIAPPKSIEIANSVSGLMNTGAQLVMTIKLIDRPFLRHIEAARKELSGLCADVRMKKLPHNREELTAYGKFGAQATK